MRSPPPAAPAAALPPPVFVLRLYVTGGSALSATAIRNVRRLCAERLSGLSDLAIIDIYQQPALARAAQLIAAPTLIKERPLPVRRFVGTMINLGPLLADLGFGDAELCPQTVFGDDGGSARRGAELCPQTPEPGDPVQ
jgi:circadian clock protein KaiB